MRWSKRFYVTKRLLAVVGIALVIITPGYASSDVAIRVKDNRCLACHQVDKKRVGPSFIAIAERYSTLESPEQVLFNSMMHGSRGRWGAVPMPAQTHVSVEDAKSIVEWILSLVE